MLGTGPSGPLPSSSSSVFASYEAGRASRAATEDSSSKGAIESDCASWPACDRIVRVVDGRVSEDLSMPGDEATIRKETIH